jgi:hypothetical protein
MRRSSSLRASFGRWAAGALLLGAVPLAGCGSGSTEPPADDPDGLQVTLNGVVVARAAGASVEGEIHVHFGEYSGLFVVDILDRDGRTLALDADHRLEATVGDIGLATFVQATPGAFRGEFEMFGEGETTITFRLVRQGSATPEWTSPPVDLLVIGC